MQMRHTSMILSMLIIAMNSAGSLLAQSFVQADGQTFRLCNAPFKFVGFNTRGICHYGQGDVLPFSSTTDITAALDYCTASKSRVIRLICAYGGIGPVETGDRLEAVLDACESRGVYAIVALIDMYSVTQLHPQGDGGYYTRPACCGFTMLSEAFFAGGYTNNYLPQAVYLADRFKDHPAIFAWQLGNEIRAETGNTFNNFCQDVRQQIRAADPNHMISIGLIDSSYAGYPANSLYADFDFIGTHNYNGGGADESNLAAVLDKPYIIDEAGFDSTIYGPDRTPEIQGDLVKWIDQRGADGYMIWGLMASAYDNGDGDFAFGVDQVLGNHAQDYALIGQLFFNRASSFETPSSLVVTPTAFQHALPFGQVPPATDVFHVGFTGSTVQTYSVEESVPWLSVSPAQGETGCLLEPVTLSYDASELDGLPPGEYIGIVTISASGVNASPQVVTVTVEITTPTGDFDGDLDVDMDDYGRIQACVLGSAVPQDDPACQAMKLDGDVFVDQDDLYLFRQCMSGANVPSDPNCLVP